uniref:Uncharacterized protein n=1 Tax=Anguilla anguilla TaxID=7936 RepID=A0A0E9V4C8_ANGAN
MLLSGAQNHTPVLAFWGAN